METLQYVKLSSQELFNVWRKRAIDELVREVKFAMDRGERGSTRLGNNNKTEEKEKEIKRKRTKKREKRRKEKKSKEKKRKRAIDELVREVKFAMDRGERGSTRLGNQKNK